MACSTRLAPTTLKTTLTLAGCHGGTMPDDGDQVALTTRFHPQHAEAAGGVVKRHALDQSIQRLHRRDRAAYCAGAI